MLNLKLAVGFNDGRVETVVVPPIVQVAFERQYKVGIPELGEQLHMEHLYWLAFETLRRKDGTTNDFDVWLESVASLESDDEVPVDPTAATGSHISSVA